MIDLTDECEDLVNGVIMQDFYDITRKELMRRIERGAKANSLLATLSYTLSALSLAACGLDAEFKPAMVLHRKIADVIVSHVAELKGASQ